MYLKLRSLLAGFFNWLYDFLILKKGSSRVFFLTCLNLRTQVRCYGLRSLRGSIRGLLISILKLTRVEETKVQRLRSGLKYHSVVGRNQQGMTENISH